MALLKVAVMGHPVLREVAQTVPEAEIKTESFQQFLKDMAETMNEYDGRGLAAPQVHVSRQIVCLIWDFDPGKASYLAYLINPKIEVLTKETSAYWEGCLSVPGMRGRVTRHKRISVEALNGKGEKISFIAEGFAATVIQHECDHLLGKLYLDRMTDMRELAFTREYQKYHVDANSGDDQEG